MKTKLYVSYLLVALVSALVGAIVSGDGVLVSLAIGAVLAVVGAAYASSLLTEIVDQTASGIRNLGTEARVSRDWPDPVTMRPVISAVKDADLRFKEIIAALTADKQTRDLILNNMRDGVLLTDTSMEVILANPAAAKIFRLSEDEIVKRQLVHAIPSQELDELIKQVIAEGVEAEAEIETFIPRERHVRAVALPVGDDNGLAGVLTVIHDVTAKQQVEAVRRDFVANVSHELKTPVSGVSLLAESILTGLENDPEEARAFAHKLQRETKRLAQLVRDLLDLSQLEAERMRPVSMQISLSEVVKEVVGDLAETAAAGGISLRTELQTNLAKTAGSDSQLGLMVRNLVDNAINYTPTGGDILITTGETDGFITLTVKDTGIGIPQSDRERVFERFYRVDKNRSRETGGTGLGLSIVKHVIDNHNGQLRLESTVGLGSKFTVLLPHSGDAIGT